MNVNSNICIISLIFQIVVHIRESDLQNNKNKDSALEKDVGHQLQFPRQYVI